jgi:signal transduction histidine kinase
MTLQLDTVRSLLAREPSDRVEAEAGAMLVDLKGQVQEALADIRRLVYALRPPLLDELGLLSALREEVARHQTPDLALTFEGPDSLIPLPAAVEVALYRIAQEALTNVVRHAQASTCVVTLRVADEACLEITDNGRGLPADLRWGVGMSSMRERAAELGGVCQIEPAAGGGTRVCVSLPLSVAEAVAET